MNSNDYREGSVIEYATFGGQIRRVVVATKDDDIKNGRPGFDAVEGFWGYDDQITRVVKF